MHYIVIYCNILYIIGKTTMNHHFRVPQFHNQVSVIHETSMRWSVPMCLRLMNCCFFSQLIDWVSFCGHYSDGALKTQSQMNYSILDNLVNEGKMSQPHQSDTVTGDNCCILKHNTCRVWLLRYPPLICCSLANWYGPFLDELPIQKWWFSIATLNYQGVSTIYHNLAW